MLLRSAKLLAHAGVSWPGSVFGSEKHGMCILRHGAPFGEFSVRLLVGSVFSVRSVVGGDTAQTDEVKRTQET